MNLIQEFAATFVGDSNGVCFEISKGNYQNKAEFSISSTPKRIEISIIIRGKAKEESVKIAKEVAREINTLLVIHLRHPFLELRLNGWSAECMTKSSDGDNNTIEAGIHSHVSLKEESRNDHVYGQQGALRLNTFIENTPCSPLLDVLAIAISQSDPIARFMCLYFILQSIVPHDTQAEVDKIISGYKSSRFPIVVSPHGKNKYETQITRLRNQIAHNRNVPFQETRDEIIAVLPEFLSLICDTIAKDLGISLNL